MSNWQMVSRLESRTIHINEEGSAPTGFGLCDSCSQFQWTVTQYGTETVGCGRFGYDHPVPVRKSDPVSRCSSYGRRGALSMDDMLSMATLITIRKPIGFAGGEVEVEIKPPKEEDDET